MFVPIVDWRLGLAVAAHIPNDAQIGLTSTLATDVVAAGMAPVPWVRWATSIADFELFSRLSRGPRIRRHRYYRSVFTATYAARVRVQPKRRVRFVGTTAAEDPGAWAGGDDEGKGTEEEAEEAAERERERHGLCAVQVFVKPVLGGAAAEEAPSDSDDDGGKRRHEEEETVPLELQKIQAEQFDLLSDGSRLPPHQHVMRCVHSFRQATSSAQLPEGWDFVGRVPRNRVLITVLPLAPRTLHAEIIRRRAISRGEPPFFREKVILLTVLQLAKAIQHCHKYRIVHRGVRPDKIFLCHGLAGGEALTRRLPGAEADEEDLYLAGLGGSPGDGIDDRLFDAVEFLSGTEQSASRKMVEHRTRPASPTARSAPSPSPVHISSPSRAAQSAGGAGGPEGDDLSDSESGETDGIRAKKKRAPHRGDLLFTDGLGENTRVVLGGFADSLDCVREGISDDPSGEGVGMKTLARIPPPDTVDDDELDRETTLEELERRRFLFEHEPPGTRLSKNMRRDFGAAPALWPPELARISHSPTKRWGTEVEVDFSTQDAYALGRVMWLMMSTETPYLGSEAAVRAGNASRRDVPSCFSGPTRRLVTHLLDLNRHRRPTIKQIILRCELALWCIPAAFEVPSVHWAEHRLRTLRQRLMRKMPGTRDHAVEVLTVEDSLLADFLSSQRGTDLKFVEESVTELVSGPWR